MPTISDLRETASTLRARADLLERIAAQLEKEEPLPAGGQSTVFDPDTDTPPVEPRPRHEGGSEYQSNWMCLLLWAQLRALNVRQGRGATRAESAEMAKRAGYDDGRAWNRWTGQYKGEDGGRWIDEIGMEHLRYYYSEVGRSIPEDLA
ncbi:hypothetical protein M3B43_04780 [Nesterenkonia massiliensis]|uniref:Uncharacterized protein n=1 Tax=Nesterenkonia massiliensis TaxID=1232429 RepID=A0ABT2HPN1_9MICC|nr:hypothetical protein [Nesterenkonia massiliensis]MCT1606652.1 hypothetical protein [Nesterenkonia massiliensis]